MNAFPRHPPAPAWRVPQVWGLRCAGSASHVERALTDSPRATGVEAVAKVRRLGLTQIVVSADTGAAARTVAARLGGDWAATPVLHFCHRSCRRI